MVNLMLIYATKDGTMKHQDSKRRKLAHLRVHSLEDCPRRPSLVLEGSLVGSDPGGDTAGCTSVPSQVYRRRGNVGSGPPHHVGASQLDSAAAAAS